MKIKNIFFSLFFIFLTQSGLCQIFPVQGNAALIPPFSLKLADYGTSITDRVAVNVLLADPSRPELAVRLRLRIESQSLKIETKPEYIGTAITLQGGIPLRLTNIDLGEYFNPDNLNFSGISKSEFLKTGSLPEGFYQFCFEVLEYNRGVKISNTICAPAWLILNDPPLINAPREGEKVKSLLPQNIVFQWTPRHTGSPNSAFTTEYDFQLVELWPSDRNPNDAILSQPPIYETTTNSTLLVYGPDATPLEPGRHYAFRVRARSITGVDELDLFKNNGYSQVSSFIYGDACDAPQNVIADPLGPSRFGLKWLENFNHTGYSVKYRLAGDDNLKWYKINSLTNDLQVNSLKPETRYEYQVSATCGSYESTFSPIASVTTKGSEAIAYSCGLPLTPFDLDPSQLIEILKVGDVIQAGDFEVTLAKVTGSNGTFTGEGVIEVPYFNKAKVKAEFSNISVNRELRMVAGVMNITGAGVDVIPSGLMNFLDDLSETLAITDSLIADYEANLPEQFDPHSFVAEKEIKVPGSIAQVYSGEGGSVVVVDSKGNKQTIPAGTTAAVTDSNGNGYLVDAKGNIHKTTASVATVAANREYNLGVKFANAPDATFGFDEKKHDPIASTYEKLSNDYYASWKSVETGKIDKVIAKLEGADADKSQIHFEQGGIDIGHQASGNPPIPNAQALTIQGKADGVEEGLISLFTPADTAKKEQVLGKLNVVTYNSLQKTVVIVPVNGTTFDKFGTAATLSDSLNRIYNQAVATWNVEMAEGIWVAGISPFDDGGTGLLSNYTGHMKSVINTYKDNLKENTFYLFLVSNAKDPATMGYMPRSGEYGFIFADKHGSLSAIARTMAHELGHGAFNLHHTFLEPNFTLPKGTTNNLMDYPAGPRLYKYQWDKMRYTDIVMGLFESDEEGQYVSETSLQQVARIINTLNCGYQNKSDGVDIHYGLTRYEVNLGRLASLLNSGAPILASEEFKKAQLIVWFGGYSISEPFLTYNDISLNLNGYKYTSDEKIVIPGVSGGVLGFQVSDVNFSSPLKKSDVFNWLIKAIDKEGQAPAFFKVDNTKSWKIDDLVMFSDCDLIQLSRPNRLKAIGDLVNDQENAIGLDKDTYQYLLINTLKSTPNQDQSYFYEQLTKNPNWVLYPYEVMDSDQREKYVKLLTEWWLKYRSTTVPSSDAVLINYSIFNNPSNLVDHSSDFTKVLFKSRGINTKENYTPEKILCSPAPLVEIKVSFKSQNSEEKATVLPAILVKYMIDKGISQDLKDLGWTTLNIASLATGVGEIGLGVQTFRNGRYILGSFRLLLAAGNTLSTVSSTYCTQGRTSTDFCKAWSEYELLVSVGLLSASSLDLLYVKLNKAYKELPASSFTNEQKKILESELGLGDDILINRVDELVSKLNGNIKKTYDELISAGLEPGVVNNDIQFVSRKGDGIAILSSNKLTPSKWATYNKPLIKIETSEGYWVVKDGNEVIGIDLGFKDKRILAASEVNAYWKYGRSGYEPYKSGTKVTERILQKGERVYVVEYISQGQPGLFASKERIKSMPELREKLAVLKGWKDDDLGFLTVREYEVKKDLRVRDGIIGPQIEETGFNQGQMLSGGGHQYEFLEGRWDALNNPSETFLTFIVNHELKP